MNIKAFPLIALLVISTLAAVVGFAPAQAQTPTVRLASFASNCADAVVGIFWDGTHTWFPCYLSGNLVKVIFEPEPIITTYGTSAGSGQIISAWGDANNIYLVERWNDYGGRVIKFVKSSASSSVLTSGLSAENWFVTKLGDYLYVASGSGVNKINVNDGTRTLISTGRQMIGVATDGVKVFSTAILAGEIYEIDPSTNTATLRVSGLSRPLGIYADTNFLYVAQNTANSGVLKISRSTWTTSASATFSGGEPYGVIVTGNYVVVSSITDKKLYVRKVSDLTAVTSISLAKTPYIIQTDGTYLYVGFRGSSGVAFVSDWKGSNGGGGGGGGSTTTTVVKPTYPLVFAEKNALPIIQLITPNVFYSRNSSVKIEFYALQQGIPPQGSQYGYSTDLVSFDKKDVTKVAYSINHGQDVELVLNKDYKFYEAKPYWKVWYGSISLRIEPSYSGTVVTIKAWGEEGKGPSMTNLFVYHHLYRYGGPRFEIKGTAGEQVQIRVEGPNSWKIDETYQTYIPSSGVLSGMFMDGAKITVVKQDESTKSFVLNGSVLSVVRVAL